MKTFISFIGSNDAGKLMNKEYEGSILTILKERKFNEIYLLYNKGGKVDIFGKESISYTEISEFIRNEIIEGNYCKPERLFIQEIDFERIDDYTDVYPILKEYLDKQFPIELRTNIEFYAGISSGTPAMHASLALLAETNLFPLKLIRAVKKEHAVKGIQVFDINLLTGVKEELEKLNNYSKVFAIKESSDYSIVSDATKLNEKQKIIALTDKPILIIGETGTGKEVLADQIHKASSRKNQKIFKLNCAGLNENLLESELFGYTQGSFTGASKDKPGIVEVYKDGTMFLDEINSMPLGLQAKLLRFLENGDYRRVGGVEIKKSNVRIIAASNEKLNKLVEEGKFRIDLYYRLLMFEIHIIPLRELKDNIPNLIQDIRPELNFNQEALKELMSHDYKGNYRELKIILERLFILFEGKKITKKIIHSVLKDLKSTDMNLDIEIHKELEGKAYQLVRQLLTKAVLNHTKGNTLAAAKILGVTHPSIKKWSEEEL